MANDGTVKIGTEVDKSGLEKGLSGLGSFAKAGLKTVAGAVAGVTTAAAGAVGAAVKVGSAFESEMSKVAAISGATGEDLEQLTQKAKDMGAATMFSASESAQAMEYMAMAGWKTADMLNGIEGIMNLAAASGEDLAATSDIVTDAMTAFGMAADGTTSILKDGVNVEVANASHFADVLAAASSNANTNVSLMGETFKYVAPVAGALGYTAEDTAVAIGLMANAGIKGSQAGTALRSMMSRLAKPTDEVQTAMEKLGVSLTDSQGGMKTLDEVMADLREGFSGLSEAESASLAASLAGQEAMSGLLAIVGASDEDFNKLKDSIYNCDEAAANMAATMQDNLQGQITILKSALEGLGIEIYESLQEPLKGLVEIAQESVNEIAEAFKNDGVSGLLDAGASVLTSVIKGATEQLPEAVGLAKQFIGSLKSAIFVAAVELRSSGPEIVRSVVDGALSIATDMVAVGLRLMSVLADSIAQSSPEIVSGIGEFVYDLINGIYEYFPDFVAAGQQILTNIMSGFAAGKDEYIPNIIAMGSEMLITLTNGITEMLPGLVQTGVGVILSFASGIVDNLPAIIDAGLEMLVALAQGVADSLPQLIEQVPRIINAFADAVYAALPKILAAGVQILVTLGKGIINSIPTIIENAGQITLAIFNVFSLFNLFSAGKTIIQGLGNGIKSMAAFAKDVAKSIVEQIKHPFSAEGWTSIGKNIVQGIARGISGAASIIKDAALNAAKSAFKAVKDFFGIESPSKLMRDVIGKNMIAGIDVGIEQETPKMEATSAESASRAVQSMQRVVGERSAAIGLEHAGKLSDPKKEDRKDSDNKRRIEVPIYLDGRELARGTAEYTDEQIAWGTL